MGDQCHVTAVEEGDLDDDEIKLFEDYQTECGRRGRFAQMAISIDLRKSLMSKLVINGNVQVVDYKSLPTVCFECSKYGHVKDIFSSFNPPNPTLPPALSPSAATFESSPYGPLMVVDRRQRRNPKATPHALAPKETREPMSARGSRFSPIAEEEVTEISMHSHNASKGEGTTYAPTGVGTTSASNAIKVTKKKGHSANLHLSPPKSSTGTSQSTDGTKLTKSTPSIII
ncbi:hypothetical protein GQ457_16G022870 [Hibiscus cannabinus]